jgi:hypothetical protein
MFFLIKRSDAAIEASQALLTEQKKSAVRGTNQ